MADPGIETAVVPTAAEHLAVVGRLEALSSQVQEIADRPAPTALPSWVLTPEQFGAKPGADCSDAFAAMLAAVDAGLRDDAGGSVPVAAHTILLGPGPYVISKPWMVPRPGRAQGLTIRGIGKRSSEIVWSGDGPMLTNQDRWMGVTWENCSFRSMNPKGAFLYSSSTGACQDWNFVRCEWRGKWAYGIGLDGPEKSNTNSEWVFDRCTVTGTWETAWLWSGMTPEYPQQDQFLNFSLRDMKMEPLWGDMLRLDKGGSITVSGGSWIMQKQRPTAADGTVPPSRFFYMPPTGSHFDSVQNLLVEGVRFELRNAAAAVIDSAWNGQITFVGCMDDAMGFQAFSADTGFCPHRYTNPGGVTYIGCSLVGRHQYTATSLSRQVATYMSCARKNNRTAASFLVRAGAAASKLRFVHVADRDGITS